MWAQQIMPGASRHVTTQIEALELRALLSVTPSFVEVPITAAAVAADPLLADYRTFDLRVHLSAGDRHNIAGFEAVLAQGQFYRFGSAATTNPSTWISSPQAEFATFVSVDEFGAPSSGVLPYVGTVGTPVLTSNRFIPVWGTLGGTPASANDFTIARLTVHEDAVGSIYGEVRSIDEPNLSRRFVASLPVGAQALGLARGVVREGSRVVPDVTVFDDVDNDGILDAGETSTTTNSNGVFQFIQPAGTHRYRAIAPSGFTVFSPVGGVQVVNTLSGNWSTDVDFALQRIGTASISGNVREKLLIGNATPVPLAGATAYLDLNNSGTPDSFEPSIGTATDGTYTLGALNAGTYIVRVQLPAGQGIADNITSRTVTLADGQQAGSVDFLGVNILNGAVRGQVSSGSNGLAGWRVYVDDNNNGSYDTGENFATTNAQGIYELLNTAGMTTIRLELNSGFSYQSPASGQFILNLLGGQLADNFNFAVSQTPLFGRVSGRLSQPTNHVAVGASTSLANWTIYLDADNDAKLDANERRTTTNSNGEYSFNNLVAGFHVVRVAKPNGWRYLSTSTDNHIIALANGQDVAGRNFLYTQRIMIAGVVFDDKNGNGAKNPGENGLSGRRVWVDLNNNAMIDAGEPGGYLGSRGMFGFEDLVPGTYTVRAEAITGWTNVGTGAATITLSAGKVKVNVPFGQKKIVLPRGTAPPSPRNIGVLSPENDLTSAWSRL